MESLGGDGELAKFWHKKSASAYRPLGFADALHTPVPTRSNASPRVGRLSGDQRPSSASLLRWFIGGVGCVAQPSDDGALTQYGELWWNF